MTAPVSPAWSDRTSATSQAGIAIVVTDTAGVSSTDALGVIPSVIWVRRASYYTETGLTPSRVGMTRPQRKASLAEFGGKPCQASTSTGLRFW